MSEEKSKVKVKVDRQSIIEDLLEAERNLKQIQLQAYKNSFWLFSKEVIGWPDLYEPLHKRVCDFIQQNIDKKNILLLLPRGTFKSSVVTIGYPLWQIAKDPSKRGMIANATYPMAVSFVGQMERVLQSSETFKEFFGDMYTGSPVWREDKFLVTGQDTGKSKEATITAYGITSNFVGSHFDYAILDDLVNRENSKTKEGLEKPEQFFKDSLDLIDPQSNGRRPVIVIGTTWHHYDLYARIQSKTNPLSSEFVTLKLPAYEGEWGKGKLLFPKRLSWRALSKQKKQQGSSHFSAQYMLNPVSSEDAIFRSDFKYYEQEDVKGIPMNKFIAVDPAISLKQSADYSAMVCVGVDYTNAWYILDLWQGRVLPNELIDQIFIWDKKHNPLKIGVEAVAFQKALQYSIFDEMRSRNNYIPLNELKIGDKTKLERIQSLQPRYEGGHIYHDSLNSWNEELELQLRSITRDGIKSQHDDLLDALASITTLAYPPKRKTERKHGGGSRNIPYPA